MSDAAETRTGDRRRPAILIGVFALPIQALVPAALAGDTPPQGGHQRH